MSNTLPIQTYKTNIYSGPVQSICAGDPSAAGYIDLEWIGSTGNQYIVTNITPKIEYNIEVKGQKEVGTALFGVGGGAYSLTGKTTNYFYVGTDAATAANRQHITVADQNAVHIWGIRDKIGYCDSASATEVYGTVQPSDALAFFGRNSQGVISDLGKHRIYYAKIWDENGNLIGNFEPRLQLSTGKPGLYDTVTSTFYSNGGTGEFTYHLKDFETKIFSGNTQSIVGANPSSTDYIDLDWIGSSGKQWFETGILAGSTDVITIKGKFDGYWTSDTHVELVGCHNSGTYLRVGIVEQNSVKKFYATTGYWNESVTGGIKDIGYPVCEADLNEHTFIYNFADNSLTIDSTRYPLGTTTGTRSATGTSMILFGFRQGSTGAGACCTFKMESCVIQKGDTVVADYVPKLQLSTGKPGLYNKVDNTFKPNEGTGEFTYELQNYKTIIYNGEE